MITIGVPAESPDESRIGLSPETAKKLVNKDNGHYTVYLLNGNAQLAKHLIAKTHGSVAFAFGSGHRLRHFMKQRVGFFDALEPGASVNPKLIADLRHLVQVGDK